MSLQVHPDRVGDAEKEEATEKFKVLTKINAVLTDSSKKELYDSQGIIDEEDGDSDCNWVQLWRDYFKPITKDDIEKFHQEYIGLFGRFLLTSFGELFSLSGKVIFRKIHVLPGSAIEERDIRKAYEGGKGCINFMMNSVPFMTVEDEPRIIEIVKGTVLF